MQKLVQQRMKMLEGMPRLIGPMSVKISDVPTGTWRYHRPVIRHDDCVKCGICAEYCPCGVIEKSTTRWSLIIHTARAAASAPPSRPKAIDFVLEADCVKEGK